eukprot:37897-Chlamydomonas_euryale.AAC.2
MSGPSSCCCCGRMSSRLMSTAASSPSRLCSRGPDVRPGMCPLGDCAATAWLGGGAVGRGRVWRHESEGK